MNENIFPIEKTSLPLGRRDTPDHNPFQRRDHLALSSLRFALGQALSAAKDLCPARDPKLALRMTKRRDDTPEAASFDSQNVFFEMYRPWWARKSGGLPSR